MSTIERERTEVQVGEREQRARTLEAAALEIEVRGWTQGTPCDDEGRVCMMGAIACVIDQAWNWYAVMKTWDPDWSDGYAGWPQSGENSLLPLADWNDHSASDAASVCSLLRWRAEEIRDGR